MKIVKAMKQVARLKGEISATKKRMEKSLNTLFENKDFDEEFLELQDLLYEKIKTLVDLKTRIMHTNVQNGMFEKIINLGELKSHIEFVRELEPKTGMVIVGYEEKEKTEFKSQLTIQQKNELVESCQNGINELTDELDDFNAKTSLIEMDVTVRLVD